MSYDLSVRRTDDPWACDIHGPVSGRHCDDCLAEVASLHRVEAFLTKCQVTVYTTDGPWYRVTHDATGVTAYGDSRVEAARAVAEHLDSIGAA